MKNISLVLLLNICFSQVFSQDSEKLFANGNAAYARGDYKIAIDNYEQILKKELESAELHYNLGNAYFKSKSLGKAILHYEKALILDPQDEDIRFNLEAANQKTIDKLDQNQEFILKTWWLSFLSLLGEKAWAVLSIVLLVLALSSFIIYTIVQGRQQKVIGFSAGLTLIILFLFNFFIAREKYQLVSSTEKAIIISNTVTAKSGPGTGSDLFILHEGAKVKILEESGAWLKIKLSKESVGWIASSAAEAI